MAPVRAVWGYSPPYLHAHVHPQQSPVRTPSQFTSQSNAVSEDKGREAGGEELDGVRPVELSDFRKYCNVPIHVHLYPYLHFRIHFLRYPIL